MKIKLYFDNGTESINELSEPIVMEQMSRPKNKRLYKCGVEFSAVERAEVIE